MRKTPRSTGSQRLIMERSKLAGATYAHKNDRHLYAVKCTSCHCPVAISTSGTVNDWPCPICGMVIDLTNATSENESNGDN